MRWILGRGMAILGVSLGWIKNKIWRDCIGVFLGKIVSVVILICGRMIHWLMQPSSSLSQG
jgi:hypothetical protein